ncbi:hypothetical protein C2I19_11140 [Chromobacterium alticapitis]|uniref:Uncharacterized protein n=1 Tax=Chromobacterium alticapitis TaxID=2073169 RepID=A0A2S5DG01_9NEIS|nr:hypothetical protein C2I19_11140 [Chromobacterium alticapitis]
MNRRPRHSQPSAGRAARHGLWRVEAGQAGATARPVNAGSLKVLQRNGFTVFGKAERSMLLHGERHDLWHMECRSPFFPLK